MASCGVFGFTYPPCASFGILGGLISFKLNPNFSPPIPGTQSGTSKDNLFTALITVLIPDVTPLTNPFRTSIIKLIGVFTIATRLSNTPLKIFLIPVSATSKSPVNTPFKNCTIPLKEVISPLIISRIVPITEPTLLEIELNTATKTGPKTEERNFTTGAINSL